MDKFTKQSLWILLIGILFVVIVISLLVIADIKKNNNWWTKVFCLKEHGDLQDNLIRDTCIINGEEHAAYFEPTQERSNVSYGHLEKEWRLIKLK